MITLSSQTLPTLQQSKNLLAFSAGVDSSALFFLLLENNIAFDIALVNYGLRPQSNTEEAYAQTLAKKHHLTAHIAHAPSWSSNFEKNARDFRYAFFDELMIKQGYHNLITAHQLNDQLEWLLMRLSKGAGTVELVGLEPLSKRKAYQLVRPLLHHSKEALQHYLEQHGYHYFVDESNHDEQYERNWFREHLANQLIARYEQGIARSFEYLRADKEQLQNRYQVRYHHQDLYILELQDPSIKIRVIDKYLKRLGYLLSASQREALSKEDSIVLGGKWAVEIRGVRIYISPYVQTIMPKKYKERCRVAKIPPKIRGYAYLQGIDPNSMV